MMMAMIDHDYDDGDGSYHDEDDDGPNDSDNRTSISLPSCIVYKPIPHSAVFLFHHFMMLNDAILDCCLKKSKYNALPISKIKEIPSKSATPISKECYFIDYILLVSIFLLIISENTPI